MEVTTQINTYVFFYPTHRSRKLRSCSKIEKIQVEIPEPGEAEFPLAAVVKDQRYWTDRVHLYYKTKDHFRQIRNYEGRFYFCLQDEFSESDEFPYARSTFYLATSDWEEMNSEFPFHGNLSKAELVHSREITDESIVLNEITDFERELLRKRCVEECFGDYLIFEGGIWKTLNKEPVIHVNLDFADEVMIDEEGFTREDIFSFNEIDIVRALYPELWANLESLVDIKRPELFSRSIEEPISMADKRYRYNRITRRYELKLSAEQSSKNYCDIWFRSHCGEKMLCRISECSSKYEALGMFCMNNPSVAFERLVLEYHEK